MFSPSVKCKNFASEDLEEGESEGTNKGYLDSIPNGICFLTSIC